MQGKQVSPDVERRIIMALECEDVPNKRVLTKRFGISLWTLNRIRKDAQFNRSKGEDLPKNAAHAS